ncbi:MAG: HPr kinase/phosphatase C-terminal domain-containing protein [Pseudorhodobacter sp.]|nr:HPr kinase/phosphatase C-terminal domain-containing protein [Pseudorhodobacter sp.]
MTDSSNSATSQTTLHASCVALDGKGLLILGPSGSGKSALALQLMALGAVLVADDYTELARCDAALIARCPTALRGLIEARGVGILRADTVESIPVVLVVDLGRRETERLPPKRQIILLGQSLDLVLRRKDSHFPFAVLQVLRAGRRA